jgi:hypothetical protein
MTVNAEVWTQQKIFDRVRKDLDLEAETFYRDELMTESLNSAITDCEQLVIDQFSDYLLVYKDYDIAAEQDVIDLPDDIYQMRMRWFHYKQDSFTSPVTSNASEAYKIRKMPFEDVQNLGRRDPYRYRLVNFVDQGPKLYIYPAIRGEDAGEKKFRLWYIRRFNRLFNPSDITDVPVPEYLLSHLRIQIMDKEGNPMLPTEEKHFAKQEQKLITTLKFLSDDEEDTKLSPNWDSLEDFGDNTFLDSVRR